MPLRARRPRGGKRDLRGPAPLQPFRGAGPGGRWQKMVLKAFKLPRADCGPRLPYWMPSEGQVQRFTTEVLALWLAEIDELAEAAGLGQKRGRSR
jgi:hypothetical protein